MNIIAKARRLESKLARTIDRAAQQWSRSGPRGPLEVLHAVLEAVEDRVEPAAGATHVFPFNRIKVSVVAPSKEARVRFAAVLDEEPTLQEQIARRLRALGCEAPGLQVRVVYVAQPEPGWATPEAHVDFGRAAGADPLAPDHASTREIRLAIVTGTADRAAYSLALDRINLGRCAEVRDKGNRLVRTNHVVFTDGAGPTNDTVSRCHAHIDFSESTGAHRIADDRSAHGTAIVRNGRTIPVPAGSRGVRLHSGDEVSLGEARLRVRLAGAS
jgi:hypothetical protein